MHTRTQDGSRASPRCQFELLILSPFQGLENFGERLTQGVALGYSLSGFQPCSSHAAPHAVSKPPGQNLHDGTTAGVTGAFGHVAFEFSGEV